MYKTILPALLIVAVHCLFSCVPKNASNRWVAEMNLKGDNKLPFVFEQYGEDSIVILNASERITLNKIGTDNDSIFFAFPDFDAELHLTYIGNQASGVWISKNKSYTLPFEAIKTTDNRFHSKKKSYEPNNFGKKWKVTLSPDEATSDPAIGLFQQNGTELTGTFLTETGDYRYLSGNVYGNKMYLSCFDGSHAFLFTGELIKGKISGKFYSGKHYETSWIAEADPDYELTNPYELTYLTTQERSLNFEFKDLALQPFRFPNPEYAEKVTIVQIMGSWCPNCMDETKFYLDLYDEFHDSGLEIITIGYEIGDAEKQHLARLKNLQERYDIPFKILLGGSASKSNTSRDFPMLNKIISYPTSLFINKQGDIVKIHTGFYGPGTGNYYTEYIQETRAFVQQLLSEAP